MLRDSSCPAHRLLYKVKGSTAKLNFELSPERRTELDAVSVEELVQSYRQAVKETKTSRFVGVSWKAAKRRWRTDVHIVRDGNDVRIHGGYHTDEEIAARHADE